MSNLTYLNDASVLHNLRQRYYHKLIYVSNCHTGMAMVAQCGEALAPKCSMFLKPPLYHPNYSKPIQSRDRK